MIRIDTKFPIWERFFTVNPLVVVGTKEESGDYNLAPRHMAFPMSYINYFGFVCSPTHGTYRNVVREEAFTVSYPKPTQVLLTSLTATPRMEDNTKQGLEALDLIPAEEIDSVFLKDSYLQLECKLEKIVEGFGKNILIAGRVVAAHVDENALRYEEEDDQDLIKRVPLLTYLYPGRYAIIEESHAFPFPKGFSR